MQFGLQLEFAQPNDHADIVQHRHAQVVRHQGSSRDGFCAGVVLSAQSVGRDFDARVPPIFALARLVREQKHQGAINASR